MAKKGKKVNEQRKAQLSAQYADRRKALMAIVRDPETDMDEKEHAYRQLRKLPANSTRVRCHNRCQLTGRPRGYLRKFKMCRVVFRKLAHEGMIPGVTKSSW